VSAGARVIGGSATRLTPARPQAALRLPGASRPEASSGAGPVARGPSGSAVSMARITSVGADAPAADGAPPRGSPPGPAALERSPPRAAVAASPQAVADELARARLFPTILAKPELQVRDAACPLSTRGGTRLVRLVRGRGGGWGRSRAREGRGMVWRRAGALRTDSAVVAESVISMWKLCRLKGARLPCHADVSCSQGMIAQALQEHPPPPAAAALAAPPGRPGAAQMVGTQEWWASRTVSRECFQAAPRPPRPAERAAVAPSERPRTAALRSG